jgi:hypothetical protein
MNFIKDKKFAVSVTVFVFSFILIGLFLKNYFLKDTLFLDWDEGIYAVVATELEEHKTLHTTYNSHVWLNKPPLTHLAIVFAWWFFGEANSEFWARSTMILWGFITLILIYFLGKKVSYYFFSKKIEKMPALEREMVFLLPVIATISASLFIDRSIYLNSDITIALAWVGYMVFKDHKNQYLKYIFFIFGMLTKSILAFYPLILDILSWKKQDFNKDSVIKMVIAILIGSLWHIYMFMVHGTYFIKAHLFDQIVKRAINTIELHFGDKFFYLEGLWNNLSIILILVVASYIVIGFDLFPVVRKDWKKFILSGDKWYYIVLFSALPFLVFLTIGRSKVFWYLVPVIALMTVVLPYLYLRFKDIWIKTVVATVTIAFFLYSFMSNTYTYAKDKVPQPPERLKMAICLQKQDLDKESTVGFLVNEQEIKNRNYLEAAQQQTETSFVYGGSPSFKYYLGRTVRYYYKHDEFMADLDKYETVVISSSNLEANPQLKALLLQSHRQICQTGQWISFNKN